MGNLDLIVNMHNNVEITLLPVERPLLQQQLDRIDQLLAQGIGGESHKLLLASKASVATRPGSGGGGGSGSKGTKKKAGQNSIGSKKSPGKLSNAAGGGVKDSGMGGGDTDCTIRAVYQVPFVDLYSFIPLIRYNGLAYLANSPWQSRGWSHTRTRIQEGHDFPSVVYTSISTVEILQPHIQLCDVASESDIGSYFFIMFGAKAPNDPDDKHNTRT